MSEGILGRAAALPGAAIPIRRISVDDVVQSLRAGLSDFLEKPSHMLFLCLIYPIVGVLMARQTMGGDLLPLLFPLVAGFAILGPFAAIAIYEVSRRRELGLTTSFSDLTSLVHHPALRQIGEMALLLLVIFVAWLGAAQAIYAMTIGSNGPTSFGAFVHEVLATPAGWALIVVGNLVGFIFAAVAFTVGVISFPLLIDKDVSFATAVTTSARSVQANPLVLTLWGGIVAVALAAGFLSLFVGLAVVLPVLGHATWHLYRHLVP